jgi:hypothetical protein
MKPTTPFDTLESDPTFSLFIEALYKNALSRPERLKEASEVWPKDIHQLLEGVELDEEE